MSSATKTTTRTPKRHSRLGWPLTGFTQEGWPTIGHYTAEWIEANLVHSQGDFYGRPFTLTLDQCRLLERAYALRPDGRRRFRRVIRGRAKGSGKTELGAAIGCAELDGPTRFSRWGKNGIPIARKPIAPDIPVAAASFEQADILFGAARVMIKESPTLADAFDVYDTEIIPKDAPGRMYRVAAVGSTNDGLRPTFFLADETHEWIGNKRRVHLVISNGLAKRVDSWSLEMTTAGVLDAGSVAEESYNYGRKIESGEIDDTGVLFDWVQAREGYDLDDPAQLLAAIEEANPNAFFPLDALVARYHELTTKSEFVRYHLNRWVRAIERWKVAGRWADLADPKRVVPDGVAVALGFDGSYSGDSTGVVGVTVERPHAFAVHHQEKPPGAGPDWRVNVADAEQAIREACRRWRVVAINADPYRWQRSLDILRAEGFPVVDFATNNAGRMVPATTNFSEACLSTPPGFSHDGNPALARHVANAVIKTDGRGPRITKEHKNSERKIDLAVCVIEAYDGAVRGQSVSDVTDLIW